MVHCAHVQAILATVRTESSHLIQDIYHDERRDLALPPRGTRIGTSAYDYRIHSAFGDASRSRFGLKQEARLPRNLVVCCDGTDNQFGSRNTNVVRLVQALARDPMTQLVHYDPGIGTMPEPGFIALVRTRVYDALDSAFATGLTAKVEAAYSYLMDVWEPGDAIYLFGFSRGAYTVRVLAGMLHQMGLLPRGSENLVPYAMRYFGAMRGSSGDQPSGSAKAYGDLCDAFRQTFAREVPGNSDRRVSTQFIGVWDTVSSVGWVWEPVRYPFTSKNPSARIVRHAVSIDERRCFFRQNLFQATTGQNLEERWFPGVHSDIGGGYPEADGGLWRAPFDWILREAHTAGLLLRSDALDAGVDPQSSTAKPWDDMQHESLRGRWWIAEFFPKMAWNPSTKRTQPSIGLGRHRYVHAGAQLHWSTLRRMRETSYRPPNIPPDVVNAILAAPNISQPFLALP